MSVTQRQIPGQPQRGTVTAQAAPGKTDERCGGLDAALQDVRSLDMDGMYALMAALGEKPYRARQLFEWVHGRQAAEYEEMSSFSKGLRQRLSGQTRLTVLRPLKVLTSARGDTRKYLFALPDGNAIESVWMRHDYGSSVCISSQVGCRMGCAFCASTIGGKIRDLTAGEMLEQVYRIAKDSEERVSHVVVMGSGEPLDNYDQLVRFIRILTDEHGLCISRRSITVSTCGIPERIRQLADEQLSVTLALSLHASSQEKRMRLMPIARRYDLEQVLSACRYYYEATGRRLTFEYSLVAGVNDTDEDVRELAALLAGLDAHVNLIPVNPVEERSFRPPAMEAVRAFQNKLEKRGINVTIRREMGADISGACGQLRRSYLQETAGPEDE